MSINCFDTYEEYKKMRELGLTDGEASVQLAIMKEIRESQFFQIKEWFKEAKEDFVSQKFNSVLMIGIFAIGSFLIAQTWIMSIDIKTIITKLDILEKRVDKIEDKIYK